MLTSVFKLQRLLGQNTRAPAWRPLSMRILSSTNHQCKEIRPEGAGHAKATSTSHQCKAISPEGAGHAKAHAEQPSSHASTPHPTPPGRLGAVEALILPFLPLITLPSGGPPQVFAVRLARWPVPRSHRRVLFRVRTSLASRDHQELRTGRAAQVWGRSHGETCVLGWTAWTLPRCGAGYPLWWSAQWLCHACDERGSQPFDHENGPS